MLWLEGLGLIGIFFSSFTLGLIPFMGPSNMILAGTMSALFPSVNPVAVGLLVAFGASSAKTIHYYIIYFTRKVLGKEKVSSLEKFSFIFGKWGAVALFIASASPIPDEPFVIPLGLAKYNIFKFFSSYFSGKLIIAVLGAVFGKYLSQFFSPYVGSTGLIVGSLIMTVIVTVAILKIDVDKLIAKYKPLIKLKMKNQNKLNP